MSDTATIIKTTSQIAAPKMFKIILHDDSFTSQIFVVLLLMEIFAFNADDAHHLMLEVHTYGQGVVGTFTEEIATTKIEQVRLAAEAQNFPLLATMEEV